MKPGDLRIQTPSWRWLSERVWSVEHAFERIKAQGRAEEDTRVRIFLVMLVFAAAFAVLVVGATRAAILGEQGRTGVGGGLMVQRGDIVDRNGRLMAANLTHYALYIDPSEVWEPAATRRAIRKVLPDVPDERLRRAIEGPRRAFVAGGLTPQQRAQVHALALPGLSFEDDDRRVYPLGATAAHVLGFTEAGGKALAGVERAFDADIKRAGRTGQPVQLSIDLRVQGALEDELRQAAQDLQVQGAVGIVTNVRTGEVLAMASWPTFDPGRAGRAADNARLNRAAASVYEMGSTFKVFTTAAGLDSGRTTRASTFDAQSPLAMGRRRIRDDHAANKIMTLDEVFLRSSNIGTSRLALMLGRDVIVDYFGRFGLFRAANIELMESARPLQPRRWDDGTIASASFGHAISVSPLALTQAMGAVLNGGRMVPLTLRRLSPAQRPEGVRVLSEDTSRQMLDLMRLNVVRGTGKRADITGLRVGGKTGSAEKVVGGRYSKTLLVSSFASVFPTDGAIDDDRYFVLILLDEPVGSAASGGARTGGLTAAPPVGRVIERIAPFLGVRRAADIHGAAAPAAAPIEEAPSGVDTVEPEPAPQPVRAAQ